MIPFFEPVTLKENLLLPYILRNLMRSFSNPVIPNPSNYQVGTVSTARAPDDFLEEFSDFLWSYMQADIKNVEKIIKSTIDSWVHDDADTLEARLMPIPDQVYEKASDDGASFFNTEGLISYYSNHWGS